MSGAVLLVARAQARRRWRAGVALTLFIGLAGGLPIARVRSLALLGIGVPAGILLGAALWVRVARSLGVHHSISVNPWLLALIPLVFLVAVAASLYTARRTRRAPINILLRTE